MKIENLLKELRRTGEMNPDNHDGSYELMRATIEAYSHVNEGDITYLDLNAVYGMALGSWTLNAEKKKEYINKGCLHTQDKEAICKIVDIVWDNACKKKYEYREKEDKDCFGMFGTGFLSFKGKSTDHDAQLFIKMCTDILPLEDDDHILDRSAEVLDNEFHGMKAASASAILHCLKPFTFPILNGNMGNKNIYVESGIKLEKPGELNTYISNCRKIKEFRDANFSFKNYRIFDIAARKLVNAWLITWNPDNWQWDNYQEVCQKTQNGETEVIGWSCVSTQPSIGDEVFLIKIGKLPRGIIAHGYVSKESYKADHYNTQKAAAGIKSNHIDVEFDRVQNYISDNYLSQEKLNEKFPDQQWSPQGSGISIKDEYLDDLEKMWGEMIKMDNEKAFAEWLKTAINQNGERYAESTQKDYVLRIKTLASKFGYSIFSINTSKEVRDISEVLFEKEEFIDIDSHKSYSNALEAYCRFLDDKTGINNIVDLNMILYGPPGTGKTYNTVNYAVAICEGKSVEQVTAEEYSNVKARYETLIEAGRIAFTTFHQSYGYEEFIEGIRPLTDPESKNISYEVEPGVFKKFCEAASSLNDDGIKYTGNVWAIRNCCNADGVPADYEQRLYDESVIKIENITDGKSQSLWFNRMSKGDWIVFGKEYTINAIGVIIDDQAEEIDDGIFHFQRHVLWKATGMDADCKAINAGKAISNFSVAHSVIKISDLEQLVYGSQTNEPPYVFIIDEINRGNISKIFGELITLLEDKKRAGMEEEATAILPYSGDKFSIPKNVFILGTMNTADRSIALMDTALRRRFAFKEMMPDSNILRHIHADTVKSNGQTLDVAKMLDIINARIECLYDREHMIGHAFFTVLKDDQSIERLASIFEKSIIPLLQEYFYDDYEKIQLVLGDDGKRNGNEQYQFISDVQVKPLEIFNTSPEIDLPQKKYRIQTTALREIESYKLISKGL